MRPIRTSTGWFDKGPVPRSFMNISVPQLSLSVALLVTAAQNKGINVNLWLNGHPTPNWMPTHEFCSKFITLELVIGIQATPFGPSPDNLSEGSSKLSLQIIMQLCGCGHVRDGLHQYVDIDLFLQICQARMELFHREIQDRDYVPPVSNAAPETAHLSTTKNRSSSLSKSKQSNLSYRRRSIQSTVKQQEAHQVVNPMPRPVTPRPVPPASSPRSLSARHQDAVERISSVADVVETPNSAAADITKSTDQQLIASTDDQAPIERVVNTIPEPIVTSASSDKLPEAHFAGVSGADPVSNMAPTELDNPPVDIDCPTVLPSSPSSLASAHTSVEDAQSRDRSRNFSAKSIDINDPKLSAKIASLKSFVERSLFEACRQADLYHLLQVSFGFVDNVTLMPPRSDVIEARPRPWISHRELLAAFTLARLRFSDIHVAILSRLLLDFAATFASKKVTSCVHNKTRNRPFSEPSNVCLHDGRVSAIWLNRYLTSLRLTKYTPSYAASAQLQSTYSPTKPSVPEHISIAATDKSMSVLQTSFVTGTSVHRNDNNHALNLSASLADMIDWRDWKVKKSIHLQRHALDQFQAALVGEKTDLPREVLEDMIKQYSILPIDILQQFAELQVKLWRHDYDGRKDFSHDLHKEVKRWEAQSNRLWTQLDSHTQSHALSEMKSKILARKFQTLMESEQSSLEITKSLFAEYLAYCKEKHYEHCVAWGVWLREHVARTEVKLRKLIESNRHSRELELEMLKKQSMVSSVDELEEKLSELSKCMTAQQSEIVKHLSFEIRREAAQSSSRQASPLVTSFDFERYLNKYNLDTSVDGMYRIATDSVFTDNVDEAHRRQIHMDEQQRAEDTQEFQECLHKKATLRQKPMEA